MTAVFHICCEGGTIAGAPAHIVLDSFAVDNAEDLLTAVQTRVQQIAARQASVVAVNDEAIDLVLRLSVAHLGDREQRQQAVLKAAIEEERH